MSQSSARLLSSIPRGSLDTGVKRQMGCAGSAPPSAEECGNDHDYFDTSRAWGGVVPYSSDDDAGGTT